MIKDFMDKPDRFGTFILLIDAAHKCISKIKQEVTENSSIKSVHTFWLYELFKHPEGLTASELAANSKIDRSLVSRELQTLAKGGYVELGLSVGKRGYNSRITLTPMGRELAERIVNCALNIQSSVSDNIGADELNSFYKVLDEICNGLVKVTEKERIEL